MDEIALEDLVEGRSISYGIVQPGRDGVSGVPIVRVGDLEGGSLAKIKPKMRVDPSIEARFKKTRLNGGEVLVSLVGTTGRAAVVPRELSGWNVARAIAVLRPVKVEPEWLVYSLRAPSCQKQMSAALNTTVQATLNLADLKRVRVPMPPESTRRAIAEVLGTLDDKIAANARVNEGAESLAFATYAQVTAAHARVPSSARLTPVLGGTPDRAKPEFWSGEVPWVSARDITSAPSSVVFDTAERISARGVDASRAKPVEVGSVILTARGTVGAVARLGVPAAFNQSCYAFAPSPTLPASCLYFLVRDAAEGAHAVAHGSVFSTITMRSFDTLTIPDLSDNELKQLEGQLAPLLKLIDAHVRESAHLAELRDTLLPHLMSGRLTVRDAEKQVGAVL